jgi:hypothetical protein
LQEFRPLADAEGQGKEAEDGGEGGHQDRAEALGGGD